MSTKSIFLVDIIFKFQELKNYIIHIPSVNLYLADISITPFKLQYTHIGVASGKCGFHTLRAFGLMSIFWTQKVKLFYAALLANNSHCSGVM